MYFIDYKKNKVNWDMPMRKNALPLNALKDRELWGVSADKWILEKEDYFKILSEFVDSGLFKIYRSPLANKGKIRIIQNLLKDPDSGWDNAKELEDRLFRVENRGLEDSLEKFNEICGRLCCKPIRKSLFKKMNRMLEMRDK